MEKGVILYAPDSFTPDRNQFNPVFLPVVTSGVDKSQYELESSTDEVSVFKQRMHRKVEAVHIKELLVKKEFIRGKLRVKLHQVMKNGSN